MEQKNAQQKEIEDNVEEKLNVIMEIRSEKINAKRDEIEKKVKGFRVNRYEECVKLEKLKISKSMNIENASVKLSFRNLIE